MATPKQEKLAKAIVENAISDEPKSMKEIMENHGYATNTAKTPNQIVESAGVQEAIKEYTSEMMGAFEAQGITPYYVAGKIKDLMEAKKIVKVAGQIESIEDNHQAIDKGISHAAKFGIGGGYKTDDKGNPTGNNIQVNIFNSPKIQEIVGDFEAKLKEELTRPQ